MFTKVNHNPEVSSYCWLEKRIEELRMIQLKHITSLLLALLLFSVSLVFAYPAHPKVELGVDNLMHQPYLNLLAGKRVALVANDASRDSEDRRDITSLYENPHIHLIAIFTPEHGLAVDKNSVHINDGFDPITHLPVYSLYGAHHRSLIKLMSHIDVVVFDLQSVGLRYYTYISTMAQIINTAKKLNKEVIILDRPNPLGGRIVDGPRLDPDFVGMFTSYYDIPMRYGMTMGELARYYNYYDHINAHLIVVPMTYWHRSMLFNDTGLTWVPPSPALQTFQQAYLYAIFGTMGSANISFGLGHAVVQEYHYYGAPYIGYFQAHRIVHQLRALRLPGLRFYYQSWTPTGGHYEGRLCRGVRVSIYDYHKVMGFYSLVAMLEVFHHNVGNKFGLIGTDDMLGRRWVRIAIANDVPVSEIVDRVNSDNLAFLRKRWRVLMYR